MPRKPTAEEMDLAAEWLDVNEGDDGEGDACHAVAAWLREIAKAAATREAVTAAVHDYAREHGVKPAAVRKALRAVRKKKAEAAATAPATDRAGGRKESM